MAAKRDMKSGFFHARTDSEMEDTIAKLIDKLSAQTPGRPVNRTDLLRMGLMALKAQYLDEKKKK